MDISGHSVSSKQLYWHLIHVTAESGLLYTISLLSYVIARASKAIHVSIIITHIIPPITGIVPVLVILRMFSTPKTPERTTFHRVESPSSKARHEVAATQPPVVVEGTRSEDLEASGNPLGEQPNDDPSSTITRRRAHKQDESDITQSLVNCEPIL
ncbi:hypothetical protein FRC03_010228 [Tulasnella sp. 419]|nr:hypothetical protein FRC03_010228 [Tulasnella sp. 419]